MLHTETINIRGRQFVHTYTDDEENKNILQVDTGIVYDDVLDLASGVQHQYREIDREDEYPPEE